MGLWSAWQSGRERRRRVDGYVQALWQAPPAAMVSRLTPVAGSAVAGRELRLAVFAIGLIVAERDALDDRTASEVARQLRARLVAADDPELARIWPERWRAYRDVLARRGDAEPVAARLARVLLVGVGGASPGGELLGAVTTFVQEQQGALNEALRAHFGAASLPDDIRPSALTR